MKFITYLALAYLFLCCNDKKNDNLLIVKNTKKDIEKHISRDTLINSINPSFLKKKIQGQEKKFIINKYFIAINRGPERPEMADTYFSNIDSLFSIYEYKSIYVDNVKINSYVININFEDAKYSSILLLLNQEVVPDNCLLIYEKLKSESNYNCFSKISSGKLSVTKVNSESKKNENYILADNHFIDYYDISDIKMNKEWGNKEVIYTKDGLDSSYVYQYKIKGKIKNHLKDGEWEERKYLLEYDKPVWINGKYINGIKDGEWYYSPDGPVEKTEIYDKGKIIKTIQL
ncbi:hypothetical protein NTJ12_002312 [Flavobacterium psychrophilum]|nr:hypothetical protein [Flavobacterium psychrophilum]